MLLKILGIIDFISAFILLALSFGLSIPNQIIIFFIVILAIKGAFILTKSFASAIDVAAVIVLLLSFPYTLPKIIYLAVSFLLLQKGFFSLV